MAIRKATHDDVRVMAEVAAAAWADEELYGRLMHPHRKTYPEDFVKFFERKILRGWYMPNRHFVVGVDPRSQKVVAFAAWERQVDLPANSTSWIPHLDFSKRQAPDQIVTLCSGGSALS